MGAYRSSLPMGGTLVPGTKVAWRAKRFKEIGTVEYHNPGTERVRVRFPGVAEPVEIYYSDLGEDAKHPLKMVGPMQDRKWGNG